MFERYVADAPAVEGAVARIAPRMGAVEVAVVVVIAAVVAAYEAVTFAPEDGEAVVA